MGTPYEVIFKPFLNSIKDYDLGILSDVVAEEDLCKILDSALPNFRLPKISLEKDDENQCFINEISYEEVNVIVALMIEEWLKPIIYNTDTLVQRFGETDFEFKSQANHIRAQCEMYRTLARKDSQRKISNYSRTYQGKVFDYSKLAGGK